MQLGCTFQDNVVLLCFVALLKDDITWFHPFVVDVIADLVQIFDGQRLLVLEEMDFLEQRYQQVDLLLGSFLVELVQNLDNLVNLLVIVTLNDVILFVQHVYLFPLIDFAPLFRFFKFNGADSKELLEDF